jgi:hypothetical protein
VLTGTQPNAPPLPTSPMAATTRPPPSLSGAGSGWLRPEDRRDHLVRRTVADAAEHERSDETGEEDRREWSCEAAGIASVAAAVAVNVAQVTGAPPNRSASQPPTGRKSEPTSPRCAVRGGVPQRVPLAMTAGR